jgi:hypothetical protein
MTPDPVQVRRLFRRSTSLPREALRLSSGPASKCLEIRFYNRCLATRAPVETSPSETVRRAPWENPPAFAFPDPPRGRVSAFAEEDAGPPRGHPASDSRALDGAPPASGRSDCHPPRSRAGEGRALLPCRTSNGSVESSPLTPLVGRPGGRGCRSRSLPCLAARARSDPWHVNAAGLSEPEAPSTGRDHASALANARRGALPRWPAGTAAARLHRCSRTSTRPLDRSLS